MRRRATVAAAAAAGCVLLLAHGVRGFVRDGDDAAQPRKQSVARRLFADGVDEREVTVIVRWRAAGPQQAADADVHADSTVDVDAAAAASPALTITVETVNVSTLKAWRAAGAVESVELDAIVRAGQVGEPASVPAALAPDGSADPPPVLAQVDPPNWGLDRLDQRFLPLDGRYHFRLDGSAGVAVYVVDSGLRASHTQVVGRSLPGRNFNTADQGAGDTGDCGNGHGSHLAGIVGACARVVRPARRRRWWHGGGVR
jgi:hypothetical protein